MEMEAIDYDSLFERIQSAVEPIEEIVQKEPKIVIEDIAISEPFIEAVQTAFVGINPKVDDHLPCVGDSSNGILTELVPTTVTIRAALSNVYFKEERINDFIKPEGPIKAVVSNFGVQYQPGYKPDGNVKKSNRGRKKMEKEPNTRKPQGSGKAFGSQLSVTIEINGSLFKIKVFRNGNMQIPGVSREKYPDMIKAIDIIIKPLNEILYKGKELIKLTRLDPVMKNYKYKVQIEDYEKLHLDSMGKAIEMEKETSELSIFKIKYGPGQSKVSIAFKTPTTKKQDKKITTNIFPSGKINILGGLNEEDTLKSYEFIMKVLEKHWDSIVYCPETYEPPGVEYEYVRLPLSSYMTEEGRITIRNSIYTSIGRL